MLRKLVIYSIIITFANMYLCQMGLAREVILENGTKVRLKVVDSVSSKFNNEGDEVNFIVSDDVKLGDTVLIKTGTRATGIIGELISRGRVGKGGKFTIYMDSTKAFDGTKVPLSGTLNRKGEDKFLISVGLSIVAVPFSLLFLTMRGIDANLPAGYQYNARVDRDIILTIDNNFTPVNNRQFFY